MNNESELASGELHSSSSLTPEQIEKNKALVMARFDAKLGLGDANFTNPVLQHSLADPLAHGL